MPLHAQGTAMLVMRHMGVVSDSVRRFQKTCFGEGWLVDVHGVVAALGGNKFIEEVPGDTLYVVCSTISCTNFPGKSVSKKL